MELIAHRAGNLASTMAPAMAVTNTVELDVHQYMGRLEVRHAKVLWPLPILWEQWHLVPAETPRPALAEIVAAAPPAAHLWVDLKGFSRRMASRVLTEVGDRRPLTVSARAWWILAPARQAGGIRTFRSVGNRWQRWLVQRLPGWTALDGLVIHQRLLDRDSIVALQRRTPTIVTWGVSDLARALELADLGVAGLIVEDLELISQIDGDLGG